MLLMAAGGLLVVLVCVDMGIKQYIEENFEEEEERETILDKVCLLYTSARFAVSLRNLLFFHWIPI